MFEKFRLVNTIFNFLKYDRPSSDTRRFAVRFPYIDKYIE